MFKLVSTRTRTLTTKLAQEFMAMQPFPGDRPLSQTRLRYLESEVAAERFHGCVWATFECDEDGQVYRVNGKHTSHLFADPSFNLPHVRITIKCFSGITMRDGAECYQTFDDSSCSHTASDVNRSVAGCIDDLAIVPNRIISLCVQGMSIITFGIDYGTRRGGMGKKDRAALLYNNVAFCLFVRELATDSDSFNMLRRGPVAGAMFSNYRESPELATEFWTAVRDGTSVSPESPDRVLQRYLMTKNLNIGAGVRGGITKKRHVTRQEMHEFCLSSWVKWLEERKADTV